MCFAFVFACVVVLFVRCARARLSVGWIVIRVCCAFDVGLWLSINGVVVVFILPLV